MKLSWLLFALLLLTGCSAVPENPVAATPRLELGEGPVYIVPFETVMVPAEVSEGLFDRFVDRLNRAGENRGVEFIILKQELAEIDPAWLAARNYVRGELYAYIEDVGSSMTDIKARSRLRFYLPGRAEPALQLGFPTESFYQNDYSSLAVERRKIAEKLAGQLVEQLLQATSLRQPR